MVKSTVILFLHYFIQTIMFLALHKAYDLADDKAQLEIDGYRQELMLFHFGTNKNCNLKLICDKV